MEPPPPRGFLDVLASVVCYHRNRIQPDRLVYFPPEPQHASEQQGYAGNRTTTTKYSLLTFLPKALFEQYRRVANIYFTLVAALSLTPYSPVRPWTTFLPLAIVLGVAMIKEAIEDYKRYRQDVEVNNRKVQVYDVKLSSFSPRMWRDLRVGDVICVSKGENFPADLLFLGSDHEEGICYIETMQLDGETNLKIKKALDETKSLDEAALARLRIIATCEPPNSRLYQFTGKVEVNVCGDSSDVPNVSSSNNAAGNHSISIAGEESKFAGEESKDSSGEATVLPLSPAAVLLRGCSLCNTGRVYGMIMYAGHDTKIFMNATQPPSKRSRVERSVDRIILFMFGLLFSMCLTGCIYFSWWTTRVMPQHWYLAPFEVPTEYESDQPVVVAVTNFITSFILYGYLIPIALYVSIEMVKVVQSLCFIGLDRDMYDPVSDTPAVARTSNLNEELGMVDTILSDKTGTLTRNVMEFFKCSIAGVAYGAGVTEIERSNAERRGLQLELPDEETDNKFREPFFNFYDERLMGLAWADQPNPDVTAHFFRLLALCHTVIPDGPPVPEEIRYEAESPDEAALVVAAKVFGFFMFKRTNTIITLRERLPEGMCETQYEVLNILEFNSTRKRMSVVLRTPDNKILLYCKGADTVIYERLARGHPLNDSLRDVTLQHMEEFGSAGLRTLCLAYAELDADFYDEWNERFIEAKLSMVDRAAKVDEVSEQVERDLLLLGCTAIEDKLQEGVPQCIRTLADAGIRLWVLTGDKMETAINIGYACSLITDSMTQFQLTGSCEQVELLEAEGRMEEATQIAAERLESQLAKVEALMEDDTANGITMDYALVIDGKALLYALSPRLRATFLQVGVKCAAVLCCRVSPLQKAQVTALVKTWGDTTLAIGDGANDVGMIQKAHIGVGISGQEGMQAAMAADFSIAQFRFLTPLLLVHGRLSYKRISRMICFFFYKNLYYGSTIFVYNAFALFSGQPIYNDFYMTLFNVIFTAAAPLVVGWFDRDLDKNAGLRFPSLYQEGQRNVYFNLTAIVGWLGTALLHAALTLSMVMSGADATTADRDNGHTWSLQQNGLLMFTIVIITVHLQLSVVLDQWTWMHHVAIWGSIVLWLLFLIAYSAVPVELSTDLYQSFGAVARSPSFWLTVLVVPITCMLPVLFFRAVRRQLRPARYQLVQEVTALEQAGKTVADMESLIAELMPPGARVSPHFKRMVDRATQLMQRHVLMRGGSPPVGRVGRYKGFVPPYHSHSRVFDANELRSAATQVGYSISASGDIMSMGQPGHHRESLSQPGGHPPGSTFGGHSASMIGTLLHRLSAGISTAGTLTSTGSLQPVTSGMRDSSGGAAAPADAGVGGAAGAAAAPRSSGGGSRPSFLQLPSSSSLHLGAHEALPPVDGSVANPVLAGLELAFSMDPRRHRRTDSKLSSLSITGSLHKLAPSSGGSLHSHDHTSEPGGSPTVAGHLPSGSQSGAPGSSLLRPPELGSMSSSAAGIGGQHSPPGASRFRRATAPPQLLSPDAAAAAAAAASADEEAQAHEDPEMLQIYTTALQRRQQPPGAEQ